MISPIERKIRDFLATMTAPGDQTSLVKSGRVGGLTVSGTQVALILDFGSDKADGLEAFRETLEEDIKALIPGLSVHVVVTREKPPAARPAAQSQQKTQQKTLAKPLPIPGIKHIIAVASGKGGVGKSTTAINIALALRDQGARVGVLDADIFGPSLPHLVNLTERPAAEDGKILPLHKMGLTLMSVGFLIDVNEPVVWRGPRVMGAVQQMLHDVKWGELDYLVVDMPPGTGDVQLTMVQKAPLSGAVIVSTPQDLALIDAQKGIAMFEKVSVPILGIIENMSTFTCPHCGEESEIFDHGGAEQTAKDLNVQFLGALPLAMDIRHDADAGCPTVEKNPDAAISKTYISIAKQLMKATG